MLETNITTKRGKAVLKHNYCTAASAGYLHKLLTLYNSIARNDSSFHLYVLCLEREAQEMLAVLRLSNVVLIGFEELEEEDAGLASVKADRTISEYAWTAKASLILYIFRHYIRVPSVVWVDSDMMFMADPSVIFDKFAEASILLTPERFTGEHAYLAEQYGTYQMGFIGFRRDERAEACLLWFREKLIEWCYDRFEDGRWADQKHADDWTERVEGVCVIEDHGINMTPFILYTLMAEKKLKLTEMNSEIYVGNFRLVLFHYYGFKYFNSSEFDLCSYDMDFEDEAIRLVYMPYINEIKTSVEIIMGRTGVLIGDKGLENGHIGNYYNQAMNRRNIVNVCSVIHGAFTSRQLESIRSLLSRYQVRFWFCCTEEETWQNLVMLRSDQITILRHENLEDRNLKKLLKDGHQREYEKSLAVSLLLHVMKNNFRITNCIYADIDTLGRINPDSIFQAKDGGYLFCVEPGEADLRVLSRDILIAGAVGVLRNEYSLRYLKLLREKYIRSGLDPQNAGEKSAEKYSQWLEMFNGIRRI